MKKLLPSNRRPHAALAPTVIVFCAIVILSFDSISAEVYRWKDANGVMHYGDQNDAPAESEKISTKDPRGAGNSAKGVQDLIGTATVHAAPPGISPDSIAKCASYARAMVDSNKSEWLANAAKIKSTCPGTGFECTTFNHHPEKNKCEPFVLDGSGTFFKDTKRDFPVESRRRAGLPAN